MVVKRKRSEDFDEFTDGDSVPVLKAAKAANGDKVEQAETLLKVAGGKGKGKSIKEQVTKLLSASFLPPSNHAAFIPPLLRNASTLAAIPLKTLPGVHVGGGVRVPITTWVEEASIESMNGTVTWEPPVDVRIIDSSCLKDERGTNRVLVHVVMPSSIFQPKDYQHPRYLLKRSYYLAVVASVLQRTKEGKKWSFSYMDKGGRITLLLSKEQEKERQEIEVNLLYPSETFEVKRLSPIRSNIKSSSSPTPKYNSLIARDSLAFFDACDKQKESLSACAGFVDAQRLLRLWFSERRYRSHDLDHLLDHLLIYLLVGGSGKGKPCLDKSMDAWTLFKGALRFLAMHEWQNKKVFMRRAIEDQDSIPSSDFESASTPVFVDSSGSVNLCEGISVSLLELIRQDAQCYLNRTSEGENLFLGGTSQRIFDIDFARFDHFARITVKAETLSKISSKAKVGNRYDFPSAPAYAVWTINQSLALGLGDRIQGSLLQAAEVTTWNTTTSFSPSTGPLEVSFGVLLNPLNNTRIIDQGPPANDEEAATKWRDFWGKKSELRRFKDGKILESVVWENSESRQLIVREIVWYILESHFHIPRSDVVYFNGCFNKLVNPSVSVTKVLYAADPRTKAFVAIGAAFNEFAEQLKRLEDIPLAITQVTPVSDGLRSASTFIPPFYDLTKLQGAPTSMKFVSPLELQITFEGSGKWPEDLEAVQKIKAAFLAKVGESFKKVSPASQISIGFDVDRYPVQDNCYLSIFTSDGLPFRIRVHYEREKLLLETGLQKCSNEKDKRLFHSSMQLHTKRYEHMPRHHSAFAALQSRFTALSLTTRVTKRWFASHGLLGTHVPHQLIELICVHIFLDSQPPASSESGFVRVMLLLSQWKWRTQPLLVPLYSAATEGVFTFSKVKEASLLAQFKETRTHDPAVNHAAFFVATEADACGKHWGWDRPGKVVASRIIHLARAALAGLMQPMTSIRTLFTPSMDEFDFIIHLAQDRNPRAYQSLSFTSTDLKASEEKAPESEVVVGWDPVSEFVHTLMLVYSDSLLLFYDEHGGSVIRGLFNPTLDVPRDFRVNLDFTSRPEGEGSEKQKVVLNRGAILDQIRSLGGGLVTQVESLNKEST
ncbi:Nrap protein [Atractiella rhizophila]|nr:Nrap protein [Atractiella rhizophila]